MYKHTFVNQRGRQVWYKFVCQPALVCQLKHFPITLFSSVNWLTRDYNELIYNNIHTFKVHEKQDSVRGVTWLMFA